MLEATDIKQFDKLIRSNPLVVVDVTAPWCHPCRYFFPLLEDLSRKYIRDITFVKVNINVVRDVVGRYNIKGVPTLLVFKAGILQERIIGIVPMKKLEPILTKYIEKENKHGKEK